MMDSRRRFSEAERTALWLAADGRCEICGVELEPGWHADHVVPYAADGVTDVINGQALCPGCNLRKGRRMESAWDAWQQDVVRRYEEMDRQDFLITAAPGTGKTRAGLLIAERLRSARQIDAIQVVAPTRKVCAQWVEAAAQYGFQLSTMHSPSDGVPDIDGFAHTYSKVSHSPLVYRTWASRHRTLVIFDEIHHLSDPDDAQAPSAWGPAMLEAFDPAARRLALSGTPFREDGHPIPFVGYDERGMADSQYSMSYGMAVGENICRAVRFEVRDGRGKWMRGPARFTADAANVTEQERSGLLASLYHEGNPWIEDVLRAADQELGRFREEKPNAGALLIAQNVPTAEAYGRILHRITGQTVPVVHGERDDAAEQITRFRSGAARWIVAVEMISEGVDLPRLCVLVYATRAMTETRFRQMVGRVIRKDGSGDDVTATVYVPAVPQLQTLAERIEQEAEIALRDKERQLRDSMDTARTEFEIDVTVPLDSSESSVLKVIESGVDYSQAELQVAERLKEQVGGSLMAAHAADIAKALRLHTGATPIFSQRVEAPPPERAYDELNQLKRKQIKQLVGVVARNDGISHRDVNIRVNRAVGGRVGNASLAELDKRIELLQSWL